MFMIIFVNLAIYILGNLIGNKGCGCAVKHLNLHGNMPSFVVPSSAFLCTASTYILHVLS